MSCNNSTKSDEEINKKKNKRNSAFSIDHLISSNEVPNKDESICKEMSLCKEGSPFSQNESINSPSSSKCSQSLQSPVSLILPNTSNNTSNMINNNINETYYNFLHYNHNNQQNHQIQTFIPPNHLTSLPNELSALHFHIQREQAFNNMIRGNNRIFDPRFNLPPSQLLI